MCFDEYACEEPGINKETAACPGRNLAPLRLLGHDASVTYGLLVSQECPVPIVPAPLSPDNPPFSGDEESRRLQEVMKAPIIAYAGHAMHE